VPSGSVSRGSVPRGSGGRTARRRWWLPVVALVVLASGCASVPTSGSIHLGRTVPGGVGLGSNELTHLIAPAPQAGMSPSGVVDGFLGALADSDGNYAVARQFLKPHASWRLDSPTTLYDNSTTRRTGPRTVQVVLHRAGVIDANGSFRVASGTLRENFALVRVGGQWRIARPPQGIALSTADAQRTLQPATVYFLNQPQNRLVAEPLLVPPDQPGLATTLLRALASGPDRSLAPAVTTAFPAGTTLVGNVPVDANGIADVNLAGSITEASPGRLARLSAQVVWTLRQVPSVSAVRLLVDGSPLRVAGAGQVQLVGSWPQFNPNVPLADRAALLVSGGRVVGLGSQAPAALRGRGLSAPALSADGSRVAALRRAGGRVSVLVGPASGRASVRWSAPSVSPPTFDPAGDVLVASETRFGTQLVEISRGGVHQVALPRSLQSVPLTRVAVSPDGARIAFLAGPPGGQALEVAALATVPGHSAVVAVRRVLPGAQDARGLAWGGSNELVTTVWTRGERRAIVEVGVDGYRPRLVTTSGMPADPTEVAAAPGARLLAETDGSVWTQSSTGWQRVSTGTDPAYAG
jgi:hypothetical protein